MTKPRQIRLRSGNTAATQVAKTVFSVLILAGSAGLATGLYLLKEPPPDKSPDSLIPQVRIAQVLPFSGSLDLTVTGTVIPHREVRLAAEVTGRISNKTPLCRAGSFVRFEDLLVEIDSETYELAMRTADAEVTQAEIMIRETNREIEGLRENVRISREQLVLLQDELDRNVRLGNAVSRSELDQAKRGLLESQNQLATRENSLDTTLARTERMQASLELAKRRQERAMVDLNRTKITAPFAGVVVRDMVEQDDVVQAGTVLLTVEDTSQVEVLCNLTESDLAWIRKNSPVTNVAGSTSDELGLRSAYYLPKIPVLVSASRDPEIVWEGRLDRFNGIGRDELTKAIPVRIVVDHPVMETANGPRALVRGMYVQCQLKIERGAGMEDPEELLVVPAVAVRPGGYVWVVEDERIYRRVVEVVDSFLRTPGAGLDSTSGESARTVIRSNGLGLKPGAFVVVSPLSQPTEGSTVRIEPKRDSEEGGGENASPAMVEDLECKDGTVRPEGGTEQVS